MTQTSTESSSTKPVLHNKRKSDAFCVGGFLSYFLFCCSTKILEQRKSDNTQCADKADEELVLGEDETI